ncbi:MAG TPA: hypothetical protein VH597_14485, partial [Verrucomicrobiae bacterium]|nr:hypothetical protein [Verrucomicrobiae bacterium]
FSECFCTESENAPAKFIKVILRRTIGGGKEPRNLAALRDNRICGISLVFSRVRPLELKCDKKRCHLSHANFSAKNVISMTREGETAVVERVEWNRESEENIAAG